MSYRIVERRSLLFRKSPDLVSDKQTARWAFAASSPRQRDALYILAEGGMESYIEKVIKNVI